jgi:signal peptidase II
MQKESRLRFNRRDAVLFGIAALVVILDQLTKSWIRTELALGESLFDLGFFRIIRIQNTGAAFGIFKSLTPVIIAVSFIGIVILLTAVVLLHNRWASWDGWLLRIGMGLVLGGAIGNQIDRVRFGHVTDFLDFRVWPAFNVADSSNTVGIIIIIIFLVFSARILQHQE